MHITIHIYVAVITKQILSWSLHENRVKYKKNNLFDNIINTLICDSHNKAESVMNITWKQGQKYEK